MGKIKPVLLLKQYVIVDQQIHVCLLYSDIILEYFIQLLDSTQSVLI